MIPMVIAALLAVFFLAPGPVYGASTSGDTDECLGCHTTTHPGIVADWQGSLHGRVSPAEALAKDDALKRMVSSSEIPESLRESAVGCAECHTLNPDKHQDSFDHNGYQVHPVVTPTDCAVCHGVEAEQFTKNIMSRAYGNLVNNAVYQDLVKAVNGSYRFANGRLEVEPPDDATNAESCLFCHGTQVKVEGTVTRDTDQGEMDFPVLTGWPNQGVGRVNPDGSLGSCAACHTRHRFAIETARKPHTCSQCHKGPDVPAYKIYEVSKHGNLYASAGKTAWDFTAVPWTVGKDFTAPTCAACHVSLLVDEEGEVRSERTHQMNDRLPWRIFGVIYAHPHPLSPDTSIIRNQAGLPLPTDLSGEPASSFLIDAKEQEVRRRTLQKVCLSCHSQGWVDGHWARFENTIATTDRSVLAATRILETAWNRGLAQGPAQQGSLFDEAIERKWTGLWLFYANSTRLSSAMQGADYGVFDLGRYHLSETIVAMEEWLRRTAAGQAPSSGKTDRP